MVNHKYYAASFELLMRDFRRAVEYVEPTDDHLNVYSHRFFELLLRACTDVESVFRELLVEHKLPPEDPGKERPTMKHYRALAPILKLDSVQVIPRFWNAPKAVVPFAGFSTGDKIIWYDEHHEVKHNRALGFRSATMGNTLTAACGLFALLSRIDPDMVAPYGNQILDRRPALVAKDFIFVPS